MNMIDEMAWDEGSFYLEIDPTWLDSHGYVIFRTHPSVRGVCVPEVTLHEQRVGLSLAGTAPGQPWPEGFHRRKLVPLPYGGLEPEDYEEVLGPRLAVQVLHALAWAYRAEAYGKTQGGEHWRTPRPEALRDWEQVQDLVTLGWARIKMERERGR